MQVEKVKSFRTLKEKVLALNQGLPRYQMAEAICTLSYKYSIANASVKNNDNLNGG